MSVPLVSIGLPVYNGDKSLVKALESVLTQDFTDFELIVSDNASTDNTQTICQEFAERDPRIRYFRSEINIGVSPNHNRVFELSRGKYFAYMAHDAEQLPGMLSRCVEVMNRHSPPVVLAYPQCEQIDELGRPVGSVLPSIASNDPRPYRRLAVVIKRIWYVTQHFGLFASEVLRKTRLNGSYASSDYVLTAEIAMMGEIREIPEVLVRRVVDSHSGTQAVLDDQHAWAEWLDPKMKHRHFFLRTQERLALEYIRAAFFLPLRPKQKLACALVGPYIHYQKMIPGPKRLYRAGMRRLRRRWPAFASKLPFH